MAVLGGLRRLLAPAFLLVCVGAHAQQARCPWMNAATAGGLLGGEAKLTSHLMPVPGEPQPQGLGALSPEGMCSFVTGAGARLEIAVRTLANAGEFSRDVAACAGATKMVGVGNEGYSCSRGTDLVALARVRMREAVITWTVPAGSRVPTESRAALLQNVAEQVTGSMF